MLNTSRRSVNKNSLINNTSWKVLKTSLQNISRMSWRRLQNVLQALFQDILKIFWRRPQNVLKTSWGRLEDIWRRQIYSPWSKCLEDVFLRRRQKTFSRRLYQDECLQGKVFWHVSLKSKFTQKYVLYYGGIYINISFDTYKILYLTVYFVFRSSLAICHIIQGHF